MAATDASNSRTPSKESSERSGHVRTHSKDSTSQRSVHELHTPSSRPSFTAEETCSQASASSPPSSRGRSRTAPLDKLGMITARFGSFGRKGTKSHGETDGLSASMDDSTQRRRRNLSCSSLEDIDHCSSFSASRTQQASISATAGGKHHAPMLSSDEHEHGSLSLGIGGSRCVARYCVFSKKSCSMRYYSGPDDALLDKPPEGTFVVAFAHLSPRAATELWLHSDTGEGWILKTGSEKEAERWLSALRSASGRTVSGPLYVKRKKGWKRRWCVFQTASSRLCVMRRNPIEMEAAEGVLWASMVHKGNRSHSIVQHAVRRPSPEHPFGFACFTPDGARALQTDRAAADAARHCGKGVTSAHAPNTHAKHLYGMYMAMKGAVYPRRRLVEYIRKAHTHETTREAHAHK
eukprot:4524512-Pleurochrysis_carterae.AAC.3